AGGESRRTPPRVLAPPRPPRDIRVPPVGFPVQFRVVGPDTLKVREIARQVEAVVAASPKVRDVQLDWNDPVRTLRVDIDQDKARTLGLAPADISLVTNTLMTGATLSHLRERE